MQQTETVETFHLAAKDLLCPVCYQKYDLTSYQPISLHCGHNICSCCLRKVRNCPMCRVKIFNRNSYSRNVLISCILEQKAKVKECKMHHRPLEFFCKDHKQLICVDCAIEGNHFAHNFLRCKEVDTRAEKIRVLMRKVAAKDEQSAHRFKCFLDQEKKDLKRKLDDVVDEFLEPILQIKKKLHKEVDAFIMKKSNVYEKETIREMIMKWKLDNESVLTQWESKGEADAAAQIVGNSTEDIEIRLGEYDNRMDKMQGETHGSTDNLIDDIKSRMKITKKHWGKLKKKFAQVMESGKNEVNPEVERECLVEFLKENGIIVNWTEKEGEELLEVKKDNTEVAGKEFNAKYFDCTLEKLRVKIEKIHETRLEIVWKVFEKILKLADLNISLKDITDEGIFCLGESLQKLKGIMKLSIMIASENFSEKGLGKLFSVMPNLNKLEKLDITLEDCEEVGNEEVEGLESIFEKLGTLKEFGLRLNDCDGICNEGLGRYTRCLNKLVKLTKLSFSVCDCKALSYKIFEPLCKVLPILKDLEELALGFEGFYELPNPLMLKALAKSIGDLNKLAKLRISFTENVYLSSDIIRKFISKVTEKLPQIKEFSLDLSRCKEVVNETLEAIGTSLILLTHVTKLVLRFRMCSISEKGVVTLLNAIAKLGSLRSLTLDCRHCKLMDENAQTKVKEHINKMAQLTEKEVIFGPDCTLDPTIIDSHIFSPHSLNLWSPLQMASREAAFIDSDFDDMSYGLGDLYDSIGILEENDFEELDESAILDDDAMMSITSSDLGFQ